MAVKIALYYIPGPDTQFRILYMSNDAEKILICNATGLIRHSWVEFALLPVKPTYCRRYSSTAHRPIATASSILHVAEYRIIDFHSEFSKSFTTRSLEFQCHRCFSLQLKKNNACKLR